VGDEDDNRGLDLDEGIVEGESQDNEKKVKMKNQNQ